MVSAVQGQEQEPAGEKEGTQPEQLMVSREQGNKPMLHEKLHGFQVIEKIGPQAQIDGQPYKVVT